MYEFKMPALGAEMTHGTLLEWKIQEGDRVKAHEMIAIVDTDKAAIEAEAFHGGIVQKLVVKPGEKVPVGTVLAYISEGEVKISPLAKKLAKELHVNTSQIQGTGPGGSIVEADIKKEPVKRDHADSMKKAIAAAMAKSKHEIPHYYLSSEIDLNPVLSWLEKYNSEHSIDERILYVAVLVKAVAQALKKHPELNGFYINDEYQPSDSVNVGFAISLREGGLIAPAILDADRLSLGETMKSLADLVVRARGGQLRDRELSDPTITITNLGEYGVDSVFGVIYPPQVALVGFGKITSENTIVVTLSADHRVSNGLLGSRFLRTVQQLLQQPEKL